MMVPIFILAGLAASTATKDSTWIALAALICVAWHEILMWDLHKHVVQIQEYLDGKI